MNICFTVSEELNNQYCVPKGACFCFPKYQPALPLPHAVWQIIFEIYKIVIWDGHLLIECKQEHWSHKTPWASWKNIILDWILLMLCVCGEYVPDLPINLIPPPHTRFKVFENPPSFDSSVSLFSCLLRFQLPKYR